VPRLRRSTKILLAGLCVLALVLAADYMNTLRVERRLKVLQAECRAPASAEAHGPWEEYAAHGPDTVPVQMPDGTVVRLPKKLDEATAKQLRAELDSATARAAGGDKKVAGHFVPGAPEAYFVPPDKVPPGANVFDQFDNPPPKWALDYVRATYPQYNALTDEELARGLHEKYQGPPWLRAPLVCDAPLHSDKHATTRAQAATAFGASTSSTADAARATSGSTFYARDLERNAAYGDTMRRERAKMATRDATPPAAKPRMTSAEFAALRKGKGAA
jgi:hypothetical protein